METGKKTEHVSNEARRDLNSAVLDALRRLRSRNVPELSSPPDCPKRASVAVVIALLDSAEVRGTTQSPSSSWIDVSPSRHDEIPSLTPSQLQTIEPHLLFIRRAHRATDRWSSHVALPGGRRDPEDASDQAAAVRETLEEVGLDLWAAGAVDCGALDQRLVTSSFGKAALLTLCPYAFLLPPAASLPALRVQESEVAGAHWIPLSQLLDPTRQTQERVDVSSRLSGRASGPLKACLRWLLGDMLFSGIRLTPRPGTSTYAQPRKTPAGGVVHGEDELVMWGLTQGVVIDFLSLMPGSGNRASWRFPTFSAPDLDLVLWCLNLRGRRRQGLSAIGERPADGSAGSAKEETRMDFVGTLVKDYYGLVRPAILITLGLRIGAIVGLITYYKRRH